MRRVAVETEDRALSSLTLDDLLADDATKARFTPSFVVVPQTADLTEASYALEGLDNCRDVFVTESGREDEPVLGWLSNAEIAGALRAVSG